MPKQIIWAPLAESDFAAILEYLDKNWDSKVASTFIELTENMIDQISINPKTISSHLQKEKNQKMCSDKTQFTFLS